MTDQVVTHPGRTEEPQCYNCGGMGHWAVACPEPTRETPAHGHRIRDHRKNTAVTPTQDKTAINSSHLGQLTADRTRKDLGVAISVIINGHSRLTETLHRHRQSLALFM
ncbi:hypothetical protein MY5147_008469 [Beauveria neobassiana]